jgi:uncharacterized protein
VVAGVLLAVALALEIPAAPTARVNDYAGLLPPDERARLESFIADRERATGAQVAIAMFRSLEGGSLEDVSIKLAEKWRIGQKGLDNGVIIVVFVEDRKIRIEVGYGLEPVVPDIVAGQIVRDVIAPRFRERRYTEGLESAVREIYSRVESGPKALARGAPAKPAAKQSWPIAGFIFLIVIIVIVLGMEASRSRRFVSGRGYTGGSGGWIPPIIFPGWGGGSRGGGGGGGDIFSGGGGGFGGGGASGEW